jgi:hypothetical protein
MACGKEVQLGVAFCPNCGAPIGKLAKQPQPQPIAPFMQPRKKRMSTGKKIGIGVGVVVLIVIVLLAVGASLRTTVSITAENLNIVYPGGATNGWLGPSQRSHAATWSGNGGDQFIDTHADCLFGS